jgi:hypothetical protein
MAINDGVMLSTLFSCGGMRQGSHHLYDELDVQVNVGSKSGNSKADRNTIDDTIRDEDFD